MSYQFHSAKIFKLSLFIIFIILWRHIWGHKASRVQWTMMNHFDHIQIGVRKTTCLIFITWCLSILWMSYLRKTVTILTCVHLIGALSDSKLVRHSTFLDSTKYATHLHIYPPPPLKALPSQIIHWCLCLCIWDLVKF